MLIRVIVDKQIVGMVEYDGGSLRTAEYVIKDVIANWRKTNYPKHLILDMITDNYNFSHVCDEPDYTVEDNQ